MTGSKQAPPIWWPSWQDWLGKEQDSGRPAALDSEDGTFAQDAWQAAWEAARRHYEPDPRTALNLMPSGMCECGEPTFLDDVGFRWGVRSKTMHRTEHGHIGQDASGLRYGFTGTREDLTDRDKEWVRLIVRRIVPFGATLVTGGCIGLDAYIAEIGATTAGYGRQGKRWSVYTIVPSNRKHVDPDYLAKADETEEMPNGTTYADRNQRIVETSHALMGFPLHTERDERSRRSGTWQTIRMGWRHGIPVRAEVLRGGA